jgi:hypothetical protein
MTEAKRQRYMNENSRYLGEALAAHIANDMDASWKWLALANLPAHSLMSCKVNLGADFIREKGLKTNTADAEYGPGWLDAS